MQTRRWLDPSQPQTLQIAVFLLYAQAVVTLLFGEFLVLLLVAKLAGIPAGYGIANERKWAYGLGTRRRVLAVRGAHRRTTA